MYIKAEIMTDNDDDDVKTLVHTSSCDTHTYIMQILSNKTQYSIYSICDTACFDLHGCH
jgi:hypothetical protein